MTFLAPGFFFASLAVAAAVVALHLIVTRQPRAGVLPTARFIPNLPATATARATRPSDLLLMLLRVLLVLAVGAGLARPIFRPSRKASARVILADVSRGVADIAALRDSVRSYYRDGDELVAFDSAAHPIVVKQADSLGALQVSGARGRLSAALVAGLRSASSLRDRADSLELVIISPLESDEVDAATDSIRALWRGRARVVRAGLTTAPGVAVEPVQLKSAASDPLSVSVARFGSAAGSGARIVRAVPTEDDLAWSRAGEHALVLWPTPDRPKGAIARASIDTIGGVSSGEILVVSGFPRRWTYPPDSIRGAEVIARWVDGEPAAVEWKSESGCIRSVAVPVNPVGDLPLRTSFINFAAAMTQACAGRSARNPIAPTSLTSLAGRGGLAPRDAFLPRDDVRSTVAPWLFGLALVAAIGELFVRRRRDLYVAPEVRRPSATREAA